MTPRKRVIKQDSPWDSGLWVSFSQCKMFVLLFQLLLLMLPFTGISYILKRGVHFSPIKSGDILQWRQGQLAVMQLAKHRGLSATCVPSSQTTLASAQNYFRPHLPSVFFGPFNIKVPSVSDFPGLKFSFLSSHSPIWTDNKQFQTVCICFASDLSVRHCFVGQGEQGSCYLPLLRSTTRSIPLTKYSHLPYTSPLEPLMCITVVTYVFICLHCPVNFKFTIVSPSSFTEPNIWVNKYLLYG